MGIRGDISWARVAPTLVVMEEGRAVAIGKLDDLLETSSELQRLWDAG